MAGLPLLKLGALLVKTVAKPVASRMKMEAKRHPTFMKICINMGEFSHQVTSRMNVLASGYKILGVKPLPEEEALSRGVNFLSESFVLFVGGGAIIIEYNRSEAKNAIKAEQQAKKEADFLARISAIEEKLEILSRSKEEQDKAQDKFFDLNKRLHSIENAASYWAMKIINIGHSEAPIIASSSGNNNNNNNGDQLQIVTIPHVDAAADTANSSQTIEPLAVSANKTQKAVTWFEWLGLSWSSSSSSEKNKVSERDAATEGAQIGSIVSSASQ